MAKTPKQKETKNSPKCIVAVCINGKAIRKRVACAQEYVYVDDFNNIVPHI